MNSFQEILRRLAPVLVLFAASCAWTQQDSSSGQTAPGQTVPSPDQNTPGQQDTGAAPAATSGAGEPSLENPPLSGLDTPRSEPAFGGRSYLVPGAQISESANSNISGSVNTGSVSAVTQGLFSLDLQKLWKRYAVGLDYVGGGDVYTGSVQNNGSRAYQVHSLSSDQRILWRTGQLAIRDNFDYLPEGTFGFGSVGGAGGFGSVLGGLSGPGTGLGGGLAGGSPSGFYGSGSFGSVGFEPRIDNITIVDATQELSARSTVTLGGGFDYSHYLDKSAAQFGVIDSQQSSAQAGYNRLLGPHDQVGVLYAYQEFHFPRAGTGNLTAQIWNALYAHRITGRLNFTVGGGPEIVDVHSPGFQFDLLGVIPVTVPPSTTRHISGNGSVTFSYIVSARTTAQVLYQRYISPGSGFLPGANTNAARASLSHVFKLRWTGSVDAGYSYNSGFQNNSPNTGLNAQAYQYWYAGGTLRRQLSPHFDVFASYQFNDFGAHKCEASSGSTAVCGQTALRHAGMIGIDWRPRPIRLD